MIPCSGVMGPGFNSFSLHIYHCIIHVATYKFRIWYSQTGQTAWTLIILAVQVLISLWYFFVMSQANWLWVKINSKYPFLQNTLKTVQILLCVICFTQTRKGVCFVQNVAKTKVAIFFVCICFNCMLEMSNKCKLTIFCTLWVGCVNYYHTLLEYTTPLKFSILST